MRRSGLAKGSALTLAQAILFVAGFVPLLWVFFVNLWERPHYQFFPLALAGAGFLGWSRLQEAKAQTFERGGAAGSVLVALSFLILAGATVFWSPWLGSLAGVIGLVAGI